MSDTIQTVNRKAPRWTWRETAYTVTVLKDTLMKMIAFFRCAQAVQLKKTPFCQTTLKKTSKKILKSIVRMTLLSDDLQENIEDDTEGYCQDHSLYTGSTEHSEGTSSENENPCDVERSELFRQIQHELNGASFDKILCTSALYSDVVSKYKITGDAHFFEASQVDEDALTWFPKDSQPLTPLKIYRDGNCLPRCVSMMAFGHQHNHVEMKTRIVMELSLNLDTYLDHEFLKSGHECEDYLPTIYAMYSGNHFRGKHVSKTEVRGMLCKEIEEISKPAWYMGNPRRCKYHTEENSVHLPIVWRGYSARTSPSYGFA